MRQASRAMASRTIIGSSVKLWALIRPGIKEGQRGKIHCRVPPPLERGLLDKCGQGTNGGRWVACCAFLCACRPTDVGPFRGEKCDLSPSPSPANVFTRFSDRA